MNATITPQPDKFSLHLKESGAEVLQEVTRFSKTIGKTVAGKLGLSGNEADAKAAQVQRTLRRVRIALENAEYPG